MLLCSWKRFYAILDKSVPLWDQKLLWDPPLPVPHLGPGLDGPWASLLPANQLLKRMNVRRATNNSFTFLLSNTVKYVLQWRMKKVWPDFCPFRPFLRLHNNISIDFPFNFWFRFWIFIRQCKTADLVQNLVNVILAGAGAEKSSSDRGRIEWYNKKVL